MRLSLLILLSCLIVGSPHAHSPDSLFLIINKNQANQTTVVALNQLASQSYRTNLDSSLYFSQRAIKLASLINFNEGLAEAHRRMGLVHYKKYQFDSALVHYHHAKKLFAEVGDSTNLALVTNHIAAVYRKENEYPTALKLHLEALNIARIKKDLSLEAAVHNSMGILYRQVGEYDSAISHYFKSVDLKMKSDPSKVGNSYTNIGLVKIKLGEYKEAENFFRQALEMDESENDIWGIANNRACLGTLYLETNDIDQAKIHFQQAISDFERINTEVDIANTLNLLGEAYLKEGNYHSAIDELEKSKKLFEKLDDQLELLTVWIDIATCNHYLGNRAEALQQAREAFELAKNISALEEAVKASKLLFDIYGEMKDANNSYQFAQLHMKLKDSLFDSQKIQFISQLESRRELSSIEQENILLTKENQLNAKELEASTLKIQKQNTIQYALITCLIFAGLAAIFGYQYYHRKIKTIHLLQKLNNEIQHQKEKISSQADELKKVNGEMKNMNESLEFLVKERTQKIESQNKKLREYAFSNSHEVRAPLSNLLGLIDLSKHPNMDGDERREILEQIYLSAIELDLVITRVNKILEEEEL